MVILVAMAGALEAEEAQAEKTKPRASVLFVGSKTTHKMDHRMAGDLQQAGFNVDEQVAPGLDGPPLKWEDVRKYNVLVVHGMAKCNANLTLSDRDRSNIEILNRFMKEGGGILFIPFWVQMNAMIPPQKAFLEPLGVTPLFDEVVVDPDNSVKATVFDIDFAKTTNIQQTPVTVGVRSLWYPADMGRCGAQTHTTPFLADGNWTVAIKGEKSSSTLCSSVVENYTQGKGTPGRIKNEVPILAFRPVGKGRLVCLGIAGNYLFADSAEASLEGIVLDKGLRKTPSDGRLIVMNALHWLAEPSLAESTLGGAPMNVALLSDPLKTKYCAPFKWDEQVTRKESAASRQGVLGARTLHSSGRGAVKEWVAAAKRDGLSYIVFLEEFAMLSRESFEALRKECAESTGVDFAAIPGFTIDDAVGNHYFYFGTEVPYPRKDFLSADGKVFNSREKGQLSITMLDYAYTGGGFKLTCGNYLFGQDAAPFANFFCNYDAMAVVTSRDGKTVENALDDYLALADFGQGPLPLALELMDDPGQMSASLWRTVIRTGKTGSQEVAGVGDSKMTNEIADYWNTWHLFPDNPTRIYITAGPQIDNWSFVGPRDYEGKNKGDFVWQNLRWRVYGQASSDVGLKSVQIFDGRELFRNFSPNGEKTYSFTLELNHDKQHNLVLVVEDMAGKKAISGEQCDRNHRLQEFSCGDRNNQLSYGLSTDASGRTIMVGGNQHLASPNKRINDNSVSPPSTFKNDSRLGNPAFDGGVAGAPVFEPDVILAGKERGNIKAPDVVEAFRKFHTGDVNVGEGIAGHYFADNIKVGNVWHTLWRTIPAEDFTVVHRRHFFQIDPDSPLAVFLECITITLKKDVPNDGAQIGVFRTENANLWTLKGSDGSTYCGNWEQEPQSKLRKLSVPFKGGAYAGLMDSGVGCAALLPLSDNLDAVLELPLKRRDNFRFRIPAEKFPQKAGESVKVTCLLLGIPPTTEITRGFPEVSNEVIERFSREYGLADGKPAYALSLDTGEVVSQRYVLDVDGTKAACLAGTLDGKLISTLPVRVSGLHDDWSAFLYDENLGQSRPVGVFEGAAWATLPMRGRTRIFLGHPVTVDVPGIIIQVSQTGTADWIIEVHNPGQQKVVVCPTLNSYFPPLKGRKLPFTKIEVPAGASTTMKVE